MSENTSLIGKRVEVTYEDDGENEYLAKRGILVSLEVNPLDGLVDYVLDQAEVFPLATCQWKPTDNDDGKVEGILGEHMGTLWSLVDQADL
jgi:hypothetical protein